MAWAAARFAAVGAVCSLFTIAAYFGSLSTPSWVALATAKATFLGCWTWNACTLKGAVGGWAYCRLLTTGLTELITRGRKMKEIPTTRRRIHPHRARPVPTRAGFLASTISV